MSRFLVWLLAVSLLGLSAAGRASAQAPAGDDFQTISSRQAYQFQVPAGWRQLPTSSTAQGLDLAVVSPDGSETAFMAITRAPQTTVENRSQLTQLFLGGANQGLEGIGASAANVFQGPDAVSIPNADIGMGLTEVFADAHGNPFVLGIRLATQGTTVYLFGVGASEEVYDSNTNFGRILDSFELSLPATPDAAGNP